ncbi:uncharacterized protein LOC106874353 isoform X2 [Octopus bimaculoides]|uniref:uncharacterized protein LOC106874353 isoform X2 n=1 Tax=Octopus bimaculoides TaxID=37653 RepID=UPI00071DBB79|nr:uncharacterized protein LOC106874353 isoform X2 [Octopus bimaculoides]|eukprot:XP_014777546.1 PREDICTED: uncharacterized protein LOC106874353 isoform X2 [Octopus bimaculoides]
MAYRLLNDFDNNRDVIYNTTHTTRRTVTSSSDWPSAVPSHSWKAIREVEGYTKPHMTWEYRLDADAGPEHQIPKGSVPYVHVRDQVRGVQDKMDRHRQLLDRYYDRPAMDVLDTHTSGLGHSGGRTTDDSAAGEMLGKVSPLRKKIRKVICKSRRDPSYYDD